MTADPALWPAIGRVYPELARGIQQKPRFAVTHKAGTTLMSAPLTTGRRRWMITCLPKEPVLEELVDESHQFYSLLPYRYLIKHGHLPLDLVKDYIYAMVSFDPILSSFVMAQNAGLGDYLSNPKIKKVANWFSQISTPPDSRFLGYRHLPPLGNTYVPAPATWRLWLTGSDLQVKNRQALLVGNDDVDTDIFFGGTEAIPTTEEKTRLCYGMDTNGRYTRVSVVQRGLNIAWREARSITTVVYPRSKTETPPVIKFSEDGKLLRVVHGRGTDVVLIGSEPFAYEKDGISFQGTVGLVKRRGKKISLRLGAPGKLSADGNTISRDVDKLAEANSGVIFKESFGGNAQRAFKTSS